MDKLIWIIAFVVLPDDDLVWELWAKGWHPFAPDVVGANYDLDRRPPIWSFGMGRYATRHLPLPVRLPEEEAAALAELLVESGLWREVGVAGGAELVDSKIPDHLRAAFGWS